MKSPLGVTIVAQHVSAGTDSRTAFESFRDDTSRQRHQPTYRASLTAFLAPRTVGHMPHAYTSNLFHIVFSTKERVPAIPDPAKLWGYLAGVARNLHFEPLAIGGTENHVHVLLRIANNVPLSEAVQKLKSNSSRWLREKGKWLGWQEGYGAFSVSASNLEAVRLYIQTQPEHHRKRSFEDEFVTLLAKSGVSFNRSEVFS